MIRISIDQKRCVGCGFCMNSTLNLFKIDTKTFKARLKQKNKLVNSLSINILPKQQTEIKKAIKNCPAQAITIIK